MGRCAHSQTDRGNNSLNISGHISIGKVEYLIPGFAQIVVAPHVTFRSDIVRKAVQFDDQPALAAQEVGKERPHWHLAAELHSKLRARQIAPQLALSRCG